MVATLWCPKFFFFLFLVLLISSPYNMVYIRVFLCLKHYWLIRNWWLSIGKICLRQYGIKIRLFREICLRSNSIFDLLLMRSLLIGKQNLLDEFWVIMVLVLFLDTVHSLEAGCHSYKTRFFSRRLKNIFCPFFLIVVTIKARIFFVVFKFFVWNLRSVQKYVFSLIYNRTWFTWLLWRLLLNFEGLVLCWIELLVDRLIIIFVVMILRRTSIHNFHSVPSN